MKAKRTNKKQEVESEIVDLWKRALEDFEVFCSLLKIYTKDGEEISFAPENWHPEQRAFNEARTGKDVILKARQVGFSTIELARDLWFALNHPGSTTLIVCQNKGTRDELFSRLKNFYLGLLSLGEQIGVPLVPKIDTRNGLESAKNNLEEFTFRIPGSTRGTKIKAQYARDNASDARVTFRGDTVHRLHITELAFYKETEETCKALFQQAQKAEIVIESTPNGPRGYFYELIESLRRKKRKDYKFHFYPFWNHDEYSMEVDEDFKVNTDDPYEQMLLERGCTLGQIAFWRSKVLEGSLAATIQEYPIDEATCFRASDNAFLTEETLNRIAMHSREPIGHIDSEHGIKWNIYLNPEPGRNYIVGADAAHGLKKDYSSAYILDRETAEIVACGASNRMKSSDFALALDSIGKYYNNALLVVEWNSPGNSVIDKLLELGYPFIWKDERKNFYGWQNEARSRSNMVATLAEYLETVKVDVACPILAEQLRHFIRTPNGRIEAAPGKNDDRVIAYGIALRIRHESPRIELASPMLSGQVSDYSHDCFGSLNLGQGYI